MSRAQDITRRNSDSHKIDLIVEPSSHFESVITLGHRAVLSEAAAKPFYDANHKRIKVIAQYRDTSITIYAALYYRQELYFISFGKRYQNALSLPYGENFKLQIHEDDSKYGVEMPEEFAAVLEGDWEASEKFENLSAGKKRSLIYYIVRFKNVQTKIDKALLISENLKMGITDNKLLIKSLR